MGYEWADNQGPSPTVGFRWFDISESGARLARVSDCDDCVQEAVPIGFAFPFFGRSYDSVHVNSNGTLQFQDTGHHWGPNELPTTDLAGPVILAFWSDWDPRSSGDVYVERLPAWQDGSGPAFVIQWENVENYDCDDGNNATWQTVLLTGGRVLSQYLDANVGDFFCNEGADMTVGVQNLELSCYVQYSNRTASVPDQTAIMWSPASCGVEEATATEASLPSTPTVTTRANGSTGVPPTGSGPAERGPDGRWLLVAAATFVGGIGLVGLGQGIRAAVRREHPIGHP